MSKKSPESYRYVTCRPRESMSKFIHVVLSWWLTSFLLSSLALGDNPPPAPEKLGPILSELESELGKYGFTIAPRESDDAKIAKAFGFSVQKENTASAAAAQILNEKAVFDGRQHVVFGAVTSILSREQLTEAQAIQGVKNLRAALDKTRRIKDLSKALAIVISQDGQPQKEANGFDGYRGVTIPYNLPPEGIIGLISEDPAQEPLYQEFLAARGKALPDVLKKAFGKEGPTLAAASKVVCSDPTLQAAGRRFEVDGKAFRVRAYTPRIELSWPEIKFSRSSSNFTARIQNEDGVETFLNINRLKDRIEITAERNGLKQKIYLTPDCLFFKAEISRYFKRNRAVFSGQELESQETFDSSGNLISRDLYHPRPKSLEELYGHLPAAEKEHHLRTGMRQDREIITVLDLGVDYNHPDLGYKIVRTPDGAMKGWDYDSNTDRPYDQRFDIIGRIMKNKPYQHHGSHVAGIAAQGSDDLAILPLRHSMAFGTSLAKFYQAIKDAHETGSRIVNISMGAQDERAFKGLKRAMLDFPDMLFVIAAGNDHKDMDKKENIEYPAAYHDLPNVLVIASSDSKGNPSSFSNFGKTSVHLAAPGEDILSAWPEDGGRKKASGTSMAAPFVSNVAGKMRLINRALLGPELKKLLLQAIVTNPSWSKDHPIAMEGNIDEKKALELARESKDQLKADGAPHKKVSPGPSTHEAN
jgi:hypothetical protein